MVLAENRSERSVAGKVLAPLFLNSCDDPSKGDAQGNALAIMSLCTSTAKAAGIFPTVTGRHLIS
jgi:hypothetical protein